MFVFTIKVCINTDCDITPTLVATTLSILVSSHLILCCLKAEQVN